jgi:inosose dehydratase
MRVGNAPVSWGVFEVAELSADISYARVMDEIAAAGYEGTELGPWGFYPTDPAVLRTELDRRGLALASAFVPVDLTDPEQYTPAEETVLQVAGLLRELGTREVILADPMRPERLRRAGRAGPADEMPAAAWRAVIEGLNRIGARLADQGMRAVVHHHVATFLETPAEIERVLAGTDASLVGLCLDTGHAVFGGGDPVDLLDRWGERVWYVHLKDVSPRVLERVRTEGIDYESAVRAGVFCPLGDGCVDFAAVFARLRRLGYAGWLIVEQDVIRAEGEAVPPIETARRSLAFVRNMLGGGDGHG